MRIEQMRQLIEIAKCGSLSVASQKMFITQQALSVSVKKMEKELGATLITRTPRGVYLTEQGLYFAEGFNKILSEYDSLLLGHDYLVQKENILKKPFRILVSYGAMEAFLADVLSGFFSKNQFWEMSIGESSYHNILQGLLDGAIDLGIHVFNEPNQSEKIEKDVLEEILICTSPLYVRVSERSPLAQCPVITLATLAKENILVYDSKQWNECYMKETLDSFNIDLHYIAEENYQLHLNMIRSGNAVAFGIMGDKLFHQERGIKYIKLDEPLEVKVIGLMKKSRADDPIYQYILNYLQIASNQ